MQMRTIAGVGRGAIGHGGECGKSKTMIPPSKAEPTNISRGTLAQEAGSVDFPRELGS